MRSDKTPRRAAALVALLLMASARADLAPVSTTGAYRDECGSCHVAYPPSLLPQASWRRLMAGLDHHFGVDASLDATTTRALVSWLAANAGGGRQMRRESGPPPEDRITRTRWFVHEHDDVPAAVWRRDSVRSPANCAACHRQAEQGIYDEHDLRIPR